MKKSELIAEAIALGLTEKQLDGLTMAEIRNEMDKFKAELEKTEPVEISRAEKLEGIETDELKGEIGNVGERGDQGVDGMDEKAKDLEVITEDQDNSSRDPAAQATAEGQVEVQKKMREYEKQQEEYRKNGKDVNGMPKKNPVETPEVEEEEEEDEEEEIEYPLPLVDQIKNIRKKIDGLAYKSTLISHKSGFEDKLLLSKAWLGSLLEAIKDNNPYNVEDSIKNKNQIPPTADVNDIPFAELSKFKLQSKLDQVLELRKEILEVAKTLRDLDLDEVDNEGDAYTALFDAVKYLHEAKFYLGFELGNIRKS